MARRTDRIVKRLLIALLACVAATGAAAGEPEIDLIVVEKAQRRMDLVSVGQVVRSYGIALGFAPEGDKRQEGDGRTPEGRYFIEGRNRSSAFPSLPQGILSRRHGPRRGRGARRIPGGGIFSHGTPDWWIFPGQPPGD